VFIETIESLGAHSSRIKLVFHRSVKDSGINMRNFVCASTRY